MRRVVAGNGNCHIETVWITSLSKKRSGFLEIEGIVVRKGVVIVLSEGREHRCAERNTVAVKGQIDHGLFVHGIAQRLTDPDIVKRLFSIVEIECLDEIHAALGDTEICLIQLNGLVTAQMRDEIQRPALESKHESFSTLQNLKSNLIDLRRCAPVVRETLKHQAVLNRP